MLGRARTGTPADFIVVGLGNPGARYAGTRHNAGADVVATLAARHQGQLKLSKKERSLVAEVKLGASRVVLAFPQTFMNDSGAAVGPLYRRHGVQQADQVVIVHDELDLPVGRIRVKAGGGLAGHNGLRSIQAHLHSDAFVRVRIGIGKPASKEQGVDHVLRPPGKRERDDLAVSVELAADAVEVIVDEGPETAMNRFNGLGA